MTDRQRIILAFTLAPMTAPVIFFFVALFVDYDSQVSLVEWAGLFFESLIITAPASYMVALVFGVPIYLLLRRLRRLSTINLVFLSSASGGLFFLWFWAQIPYGLGSISGLSSSEVRNAIALGVALGGGVAWCFSMIAGITMRSNRRSKLRDLA